MNPLHQTTSKTNRYTALLTLLLAVTLIGAGCGDDDGGGGRLDGKVASDGGGGQVDTGLGDSGGGGGDSGGGGGDSGGGGGDSGGGGGDASSGPGLAGQATVTVSFNDSLKKFINDGVKEGDKPTCRDYYYWTSKFPRTADKTIELTWASPVTIGRVAVDTVVHTGSLHPNCNNADVGRTFGFQTVKIQVDSGSGYKDVGTADGKTDDWSVSFTPVSATKLRLIIDKSVSLTTNPIVFEVEVFAK